MSSSIHSRTSLRDDRSTRSNRSTTSDRSYHSITSSHRSRARAQDLDLDVDSFFDDRNSDDLSIGSRRSESSTKPKYGDLPVEIELTSGSEEGEDAFSLG